MPKPSGEKSEHEFTVDDIEAEMASEKRSKKDSFKAFKIKVGPHLLIHSSSENSMTGRRAVSSDYTVKMKKVPVLFGQLLYF